MFKKFSLIFFLLFLCSLRLWAQLQPMDVIVNEIYNDGNSNLEWTEIMVVKDNVSLAGCFLGDNNAITSSWQPKIRFTNHPLWQGLRSGTYIVINHAIGSDNCSLQPEDVDKSDGFIRVCSKNSLYFTGGSAVSLNIAIDGDFVHLVDPNGQHLHGLGFDNQPGSSVTGGTCQSENIGWTNTATAVPDLRPCGFFNFHQFRLLNNRSIGNLSGLFPEDFEAGIQTDSVNNKVGQMIVPSPGHGNTLQNQQLIARWREPKIDSQRVCAQVDTQGARFTWRKALDPVAGDNTTGYLILKNVGTNLFPEPMDGTEYAVGDTIRSGNLKAVVEALKSNSLDTTYLDSTITNQFEPVFYRVFAFRYSNTSGVSTFDRGRAYNTNEVVEVLPTTPTPTITPSQLSNLCQGDSLVLQAGNLNANSELVWSTGDTTLMLIVRTGGSFFVQATAAGACISNPSTPVEVMLLMPPMVDSLTLNPRGDSVSAFAPGAITYVWTFNGTPLSTQTMSIATVGTGLYTVQAVGANGCISPPFNLLVTRVKQKSSSKLLRIWPNPVTNQLYLEGMHAPVSNIKAQLFYPTGQYQDVWFKWRDGIAELEVNHLPSGVYMLGVLDNQKWVQLKFSVE
jgi:hypothetical protein